jgi:serine/threonine-protein kinase
VHPYLEAVCIKCLQKDPSRRYASASELAEDLVAISEGKPPAIRSLSRVQRLVYWAWRHPRATTRVAGAVALLSAVFALGLLLWQAQARRTSEQLANNAAIASGQAGAVLFQLRSYGDKISRATSVPEIVAYTHEAEITENVGPELKRAAEGFDAVFVVSRSGYMRAQWPLPPANLKLRDYSFRNYFRGAAELAALGRRVVHVARAFRSERDAEMKFGLSMPIFEGDTWVGVMVGIISTDSVFGRLQLPKDSERSVALIGPRDQERNEPAPSSRRFVYLVHERLKQGQEVAAPLPAGLRHFDGTAEDREPFELVYDGSATYADFSDPLYEAGNHWAAAFAPVGRTGYVIVAQSRKLRTWDWWFAW